MADHFGDGALGAGLVLGTVVTLGLIAVAFGALIGAAGGSMRALEGATFPALMINPQVRGTPRAG